MSFSHEACDQGFHVPAYFESVVTHHLLGSIEVPDGLSWPDYGYNNFGISIFGREGYTVRHYQDLPPGEELAAQALVDTGLSDSQRDAWVHCLASTIEVIRGTDNTETTPGRHRMHAWFRAGYLLNIDELPGSGWHTDPMRTYTCVYVGEGTQELSEVPRNADATLDQLAISDDPESWKWMDTFMPGEIGSIGPRRAHRMYTAHNPELDERKLRAIFIGADYWEPDTALPYLYE